MFLARDTNSLYVDNRAPLVAGKPENRQLGLTRFDGHLFLAEYSTILNPIKISANQ